MAPDNSIYRFNMCRDIKDIKYQLTYNQDLLNSLTDLANYMFSTVDHYAEIMNKEATLQTLDKLLDQTKQGIEIVDKINDTICPFTYIFEANKPWRGFYVKRD